MVLDGGVDRSIFFAAPERAVFASRSVAQRTPDGVEPAFQNGGNRFAQTFALALLHTWQAIERGLACHRSPPPRDGGVADLHDYLTPSRPDFRGVEALTLPRHGTFLVAH